MRIRLAHAFEKLISIENLLGAWTEFVRGKRYKKDVIEFYVCLGDNIVLLHSALKNKTYQHGGYYGFSIFDPKPRSIHKARVRDRLLHHAIYRVLYPFFDKKFIADSFSCRIGKGTHKALNRFRSFSYITSQSGKKQCWILKCDVRKFFANIDHDILVDILRKDIEDSDILWLLEGVIRSFSGMRSNVGLPLGNLTSQLLVNIYMNEFDQFMKHTLKVKYYIRYADDFVVFSRDKNYLETLIPIIKGFLYNNLKLELHPQKVSIKSLTSGVDFLGWVHFPDHRVLRTVTKKRMFRRIEESDSKEEMVASYLGMLSHGNGRKLQKEVKTIASLCEMTRRPLY
ncbi:MAG: reverse transcriptase/maturase family protein [Patescibacteria group bacterium]